MKKWISLLFLISFSSHAVTVNQPIATLPVGSASGTTTNDSFPYTDYSAGTTKRMYLWDLINLPPLSSLVSMSGAHSYGVVLDVNGGTVTSLTPDASTLKVLISGGSSAYPSWGLLTNNNLSGSAAISNSNLAAMSSSSTTVGTVKGNISGVSAVPSDLTLTSASTASSVVYRDSSSNFSAGTITASLTGTASGNTTYTPNQYGVVVSGSTNAMSVIAPDASTTKVLTSSGTGAAPTWQDFATSSQSIQNVGFNASISSNQLVIALTQSDGSTNCSTASSSCNFYMRSATATSAGYQKVSVTSALSITVGSTASLGNSSGAGAVAFVYFLQDTANDLCISNAILDEGQLWSATATPATTSGTLYCSSSHTSRPVRLVGEVIASWSNPNWGSITQTSLNPFRQYARGFPGQVITTAGANCPPGTVAADGSAISRSTYASLFGILSTTYGVGNGSTTFNIPDYRGIFLRGSGTNGTLAYSAGGSVSSSSLGTYVNDQIQGHKHSINDPGHTHNSYGQSGIFNSPGVFWATNTDQGAGTGVFGQLNTTNITVLTPLTDGTNGTPRTGTETRPFNTAATYCIWY